MADNHSAPTNDRNRLTRRSLLAAGGAGGFALASSPLSISAGTSQQEFCETEPRPTDRRGQITVRRRNRSFRDCEDAARTIRDADVVGEATACYDIEGSDRTFFGTDPVEAKRPVSISLTRARIRLRVPTWRDMSPAEKALRDDFVDDLEVHERGHVTLADSVADAFSTTLSAEGQNRTQAAQKLREKAEEYQEKARTELGRIEARYDEVTNHGITQSRGPTASYTVRGLDDEPLATGTFPGGDDVAIECDTCKEAVQISDGVHHLGDGVYSDRINCCFEEPVEGLLFQEEFGPLSECQTDASSAEIAYTHRGVQIANPILLNGQLISATPGSPEDGSTTVDRFSFDPTLLRTGTNLFEVITLLLQDLDDFEISDVRLELTID